MPGKVSTQKWILGTIAATATLLGIADVARAQGRTAPKPPQPTPQPRPVAPRQPVVGVVTPPAYVYRPTPTVITPPLYTPPAIVQNPWGVPTILPSTYTPPIAISKDPGKYVRFPSGIQVNPSTRTIYNPYTDTFVRPDGTTYARDFWTGSYTNPLSGGVYNPYTGVTIRPAWTMGLTQGPFSPWATNPLSVNPILPNPAINPNPFLANPVINPNPFLNLNPVVNPNPFLANPALGVNPNLAANPFGVANPVGFGGLGNNLGQPALVNLPPLVPLARPQGLLGPLPGLAMR